MSNFLTSLRVMLGCFMIIFGIVCVFDSPKPTSYSHSITTQQLKQGQLRMKQLKFRRPHRHRNDKETGKFFIILVGVWLLIPQKEKSEDENENLKKHDE